jgi:hypothetical protein
VIAFHSRTTRKPDKGRLWKIAAQKRRLLENEQLPQNVYSVVSREIVL